jgi:hypothetical protein
MHDRERKSFNGRAFVALTAAISGIGLPLTGLASHLCQAHPITNSYHAWMSAHNSLGILFFVSAIWHAVLNRRALAKYLRAASPRLSGGSRETIYAVALVAVVLSVALAHLYAM